MEVHNVKAHWSELLQVARHHAVNNAQSEVAMSIRDWVEVYQEYQAKYKEFSESGLTLRCCLYSVPMTIVTELEEWHDRISCSAFTMDPGCKPILEPSLDPPAYGQMMTIVLGQIQYQGAAQGQQQGDPRDSVFYSDITMIPVSSSQSMMTMSNVSQTPHQVWFEAPAQNVSAQAGSSQVQQPGQLVLPGNSQVP